MEIIKKKDGVKKHVTKASSDVKLKKKSYRVLQIRQQKSCFETHKKV
jgi:hypothetical protein